MDFFSAMLLGVVEGLTEFLPISSTGHLILVSSLLGLDQTAFHKSFEVSIQLGSILAVIAVYWRKLLGSMSMIKRLIVGFLPTGVLGFLLYKHIKSLFVPEVAAVMLIVGGVIFLLLEWKYKEKEHHIGAVENISYRQAFWIGLAQSIAMIPGTSRSAATIIGGLMAGLKRKTAVEFSFLLAVPTMIAATGYDILKHHEQFDASNWQALGVGFVTAFFVALAAIKLFLAFVSRYSFVPFGIYRIVIGCYFLWFLGVI